MVGSPGPALKPDVRFTVHAPTGPLNETQLPVGQGAPNKRPVVDPPLVSSSSTPAIAFEAKPAANSGAAASAIVVRSFLVIVLSRQH
jgi:hypothetical protein